jgi:predicted transcriptional regulator
MKLSSKEQELMQYIWEKDEIYLKEILTLYPEPKPAMTTLATLLKRLQVKGAIGYKQKGKSRLYFAKIPREKYSSFFLKGMINSLFQGSSSRFASFFAKNTELSKEELIKLRSIIDDKLKDSQ